MCGFAGIVRPGASEEKERVDAMLDTIRHRGPDEQGVYMFSNCALGHVRLSIVDMVSGRQPMLSEHNDMGVVFNGEIYGFREIREELYADGTAFHTNSDTEVLLALYQKYGGQMLSHLPGMFAFALWDDREQRLFCARDRFGEKPFYYAVGRNGELIFASEIKSILASNLVDPVLDMRAVSHYLHYSYIYPTLTIYKNIFTLPPAHALCYHAGQMEVEPYWTLPTTNVKIGEEEAVEEFTRLFHQAVRRQLVADVPVGAFLSGGLDSGSVVAVASDYVPKLTTISFAFREGLDESPIAHTMAERYGTNHIDVRDIDFDKPEMLMKMQEIFDEPFADPAAIPAYLIAKEARKYAKVVLTGDAGDEMLGGYDTKYSAFAYARRFAEENISVPLYRRRLQASYFAQRVKRKLKTLCSVDGQTSAVRDTEIRMRALGIYADAPQNIADYARSTFRLLSKEQAHALGLAPLGDDYWLNEGLLGGNALDDAIRIDLLDYLPGNGFVKSDRTTMAVSLESRTPFCDVELAMFAISLPFSMKVREKSAKYIMRKALGNRWTDAVKGFAKNGFSPPFGAWLQEPKVKEMTSVYLHERDRKIFDVLDFDGVQAIMKDQNAVWQQWMLLQLSMWLELHPCRLA